MSKSHDDGLTSATGRSRGALLATSGVVCALAALWLVTPEPVINALSESVQRLFKKSEILCLDFERKSLKDPDSARLQSKKYLKGDSIVWIEYTAKNGFGHYGHRETECVVLDGKLDESLTMSHRAAKAGEKLLQSLAEETATIQAQINCLRSNKAALLDGRHAKNLPDCNAIKSHPQSN